MDGREGRRHPLGPDGWPSESGGPCVCACTSVLLSGVLYGPGTRAEADDAAAGLPPGTPFRVGLHGWSLARGDHTGVGTLEELPAVARARRAGQVPSADEALTGPPEPSPYAPFEWERDPLR